MNVLHGYVNLQQFSWQRDISVMSRGRKESSGGLAVWRNHRALVTKAVMHVMHLKCCQV